MLVRFETASDAQPIWVEERGIAMIRPHATDEGEPPKSNLHFIKPIPSESEGEICGVDVRGTPDECAERINQAINNRYGLLGSSGLL